MTRSRDEPLGPSRSAFFAVLLDYNAAVASEAELFRTATTRRQKCYAHFSVGLSPLGDGDRDGARSHLRQALDSNFYFILVYDLSRVLLDRLERDRQWPPWIDEK